MCFGTFDLEFTYIWRNFQKTPKNPVLYTKRIKLHPKTLFHKTKTVAPIAV